jgi:hypothetical protein
LLYCFRAHAGKTRSVESVLTNVKRAPFRGSRNSFSVQEVVSETPFTIPIVDSATGQIVGEASAILMEYVYGIENIPFGPSFRSHQVLALLDEDTGFTFGIEGLEEDVPSGEVPEVLQIVLLDSFRFVKSSSSTGQQQPQQPPLQQQPIPPTQSGQLVL